MLRFASSVLPCPYDSAAGSKRWVSSNCALGETSPWFLKSKTWLRNRASRMTSKSASARGRQHECSGVLIEARQGCLPRGYRFYGYSLFDSIKAWFQWAAICPYQGLPVRFSMSALCTTAPNLIPEPSGRLKGSIFNNEVDIADRCGLTGLQIVQRWIV
jgi:hypothetical protein